MRLRWLAPALNDLERITAQKLLPVQCEFSVEHGGQLIYEHRTETIAGALGAVGGDRPRRWPHDRPGSAGLA